MLEGRLNRIGIMRLNTSGIDGSGLGCWIGLLIVFWLLATVGLGWIVKSLLVAIAFIIVTPAIAYFGFRWWLQRNLVQDQCPVCSYEFTGLKNTDLSCPSCGEPLQIEGDRFKRLTPPGTIDVEAIEVSVQQIEDS